MSFLHQLLSGTKNESFIFSRAATTEQTKNCSFWFSFNQLKIYPADCFIGKVDDELFLFSNYVFDPGL